MKEDNARGARDGGPAYPVPRNVAWDDEKNTVVAGMSLRDYFAGQALAGLTAIPMDLTKGRGVTSVAEVCYLMADAMLAAREQGR